MTVFTDREAAVEELVFLANSTGVAHAIVYACGGMARETEVVPLSDIGRRMALVVCEPESGHA